MHPAFSVIFLTTLIGVAQGFFVALYAAEVGTRLDWLPVQEPSFYALGSLISFLFLAAGLFASFFHLGRPERAWRAAAMWRTSWLSREVIVLPAFAAWIALWAALGAHAPWLLPAGALLLAALLWWCTAMIYACLRFIQEWAHPLTVVNYALVGLASGAVLGVALAAVLGDAVAGRTVAPWALGATAAAGFGRWL